MKAASTLTLLGALALLPGTASAALSLTALTTFGGDGWLAPAEGGITWLSASDGNQRGLAFNPATGHLLLVSAANEVRILDAKTGASLGTLDVSGVTGGARALNQIKVASDGTIYAASLTTASVTTPFKIYKWTGEGVAPSVAYSGDGGYSTSPGVRLGDTFDIGGTASAPTFIASGSGTLGFASISLSPSTSAVAVNTFTATSPATVPAVSDLRLGLTYIDSDTILGTAGGTARLIDFTLAPAAGNTAANISWNASERALDYANIAGTPVLVTVRSINNVSPPTDQSTVRLYDMTNPAAPALLDTKDLATTDTNNGNATGAIAFGTVDGAPAVWVLNTNNGIQAFALVPEPASAAFAALSLLGLGFRRRR